MSQPTWAPSKTKACSERQAEAIARMISELETYDQEFADAWIDAMRERYRAHDFSRFDASLAITNIGVELENRRALAEIDLLPAVDSTVVLNAPAVPKGRYAVDTDANATNSVAFYQVSEVDETSRRVAHQVADSLTTLPAAQAEAVLYKIALDPKAAAIRYGLELGVCGRCGIPLTNDESRARGIGPTCATKL